MRDLRNGLLRLHKTLLDSERDSYERDIARIATTGQMLQLVLHDPFFAWLHELSELVVLIDELMEAEEPAEVIDADRLVEQARDLVAPAEEGTGFRKRYFEAMQRDPGVVLAHREMTLVLERLENGETEP
ncbi:MAG: hypothetical protein WD696_10755 [Bryobacteraceae bacterium]